MGTASATMGGLGTNAINAALQGFNYGTSSPLNGSLATTGMSANNVLSSLLGNTPGNTALNGQAANGFQNYLGASGFPTSLAMSQMGVTNQAAANGTYNSGGTIRAADQNATTMGSQAASNYANYLGGLSNQGQSGVNSVVAAGTGGGVAATNAAMQNANASGQLVGGGINGILGLGGLL